MKWRSKGFFGPTMVAGGLVILPLAVTLYVLWVGFKRVDGILGRWVTLLLGRPFPGAGAVITILLLTLFGIVVKHFAGRRLLDWLEFQIGRVPLVSPVYLGLKQMVEAISKPETGAFRQAILVEYPRPGAFSVGFLTNKDYKIGGYPKESAVSVFMPTALNPTSGFFIIVPRTKVQILDMSIEDAFKLVVSGGVLVPDSKTAEVSRD